MNLKENKWEYTWEDLRRGKKKGNDVIYYKILKRNALLVHKERMDRRKELMVGDPLCDF